MRKNKHLLLWSSLGALALLVAAAVQENLARDWRRLQREAHAAEQGFEIRLRQIVVPALGATDRCVSCHAGMAPGETAVTGQPALAPHPEVGHDLAAFGCVACHAGQGRATDRADAHGTAPHWPTPMLPRAMTEAGCGGCHTHLAVPELARLREGRAVFERRDCLACHRLDGRGGTLRPDGGGMEGPDLSRAGATGYREDWYEDHLARLAAAREGVDGAARPWLLSFGPLPEEDRVALATLLGASVGAPRLVEAKAVFHSLGCRGCHKVGGVGGDDGPDLTHEGERDPGRLDFAHVPSSRELPPRSLAAWLAEHFRAPGRLVPGSQMPALGLSEREIEALTLYMLSLRRSDVPEAFWPADRIRAERFGEREFSTDGATLYGTFCAACHGPAGEGMRYPGMAAFPAIASPDFLALASDEFIATTIRRGRPGRRMPAWGEKEGGLRPAEIDAVVAYLRARGDGVAPPADGHPRRWVDGDAAIGAHLYSAYCASCHGEGGGGGEGPALANPILLASAGDTYLVETIRRGRRNTSMEGFALPSTVRPALAEEEILAIVSFLRTWEKETP